MNTEIPLNTLNFKSLQSKYLQITSCNLNPYYRRLQRPLQLSNFDFIKLTVQDFNLKWQ